MFRRVVALRHLMRPVRPHIRHASGEEGLQLKGVQHRITADEKIKVARMHCCDEDGDLLLYELSPHGVEGALPFQGQRLVFADIVEADTVVIKDTPFGMLENNEGLQLQVISPVDGEVVAVNPVYLESPGSAISESDAEWMVRLIPFYTHDDSDPAWEALKPLEDKPSDEQQ